MYAKTALKEYIDNNLKIDFNSQCDSYTFSKTDTSCFMAGGGKNVWKYTFEKLPFNVMKNAGYSTVRISFTIDLERKTSDSAYLSVWLDSNMTNYFSGWDKVKLKKGWGTYEFIVNRDGKEDINLSDLNVDKLTMKFDAWGSWKYQVGTRTINLEFK